MKLQLKFIYILLSLFLLFYILNSILMNAVLGEGIYVHAQIDKYFWPAIAIFILMTLCYIFITQIFKIKKLVLKIIVSIIFANLLLFISVLFLIMVIYEYPDPRTANINGKTYIVQKERINPRRWTNKFYEELNWYSMKEVSEEQQNKLQKSFK